MFQIIKKVLFIFLIGLLLSTSILPPAQSTQALSVQRSLYMVKDINAGAGSANLKLGEFLYSKGFYFFSALDADHGQELWITDLTENGTKIVKDITPGPVGSPNFSMVVFKDKLYFFLNSGEMDKVLWVSDGTEEGTVVFKTFEGMYGRIHHLYATGTALFIAMTQADPFATRTDYLFGYDGSEAGIVLLKKAGGLEGDIYYPGSIGRIYPIGDLAYFPVYNRVTDAFDPWRSDGTPQGTYRLSDTVPGRDNSDDVFDFIPFNNAVYFLDSDGFIWKTNGANSTTNTQVGGGPLLAFVSTQSRMYFYSYNYSSGNQEIYVSDGTPAGTRMYTSMEPALGPLRLYSSGSTLFFYQRDGQNTYELWASDASGEGAIALKTFEANQSILRFQTDQVTGEVYLFIVNNEAGSTYTFEIWKSDGTVAGTSLLLNIPNGDLLSPGAPLSARNGVLLFSGETTASGYELWVFDPGGPIFLPIIARD